MKTYYYHKFSDDLIKSNHQNYTLPSSYKIFPTSRIKKLQNKLIRILATGFAWFYSRIILRVHVVGKNKLKNITGGYFVYANHTLIMGDVFTPLTIFPVKNFYAIASQANWGIPFIGKHLVRYGGLPVGKNIKQSDKLIKAIQTIIKTKKGIILVYPEAHVWPYYPKIRPFGDTSMHFPIYLNAPSFTATTTYRKRRFSKKPKITVYLDGPFYPDKTLPKKKAQVKLHHEIFKALTYRSKISDYSYYKYKQK